MSGTHTTEYMKDYYSKGREEIIIKLGGKCSFCGSNEDLEIHHNIQTLSGTGRGSLKRLTDWKRNIEYLKLLCHGCHEKYHIDFGK